MARRFDSKSPARGKSRGQTKDERREARARAASGETGAKAGRAKAGGAKAGAKAGGAKAGGAKAGRAKGTAKSEGERALESRLERLEQEVALQAERSEELLEKVQTVIAGGHVTANGSDDDAPEREDED